MLEPSINDWQNFANQLAAKKMTDLEEIPEDYEKPILIEQADLDFFKQAKAVVHDLTVEAKAVMGFTASVLMKKYKLDASEFQKYFK